MTDRALRTTYIGNWVVPISSPPIPFGAIVVEGSKIVFVGPREDAPPADVTRDTHGIILPGLVNAHTHLELTVMRGMLEGLDFREWLRTLTAARAHVLDENALMDSAVIGIHEGLLAGITTYADTTASGIPLAAMRATRVRGIGYVEVFGPSESMAATAIADLRERVLAWRVHDTPLVTTGVSPHAPYTVSPALFRLVGEFARAHRLPVAVHVAESDAESDFVRDGSGPFADGLRARGIAVEARHKSPIQFLSDTGILDDTRALLIHCIQADANDVRLMVSNNCTVVHCPISNAKLGHGVAPLHLFLKANIATGLGSDSVVSNNRMHMLSEARMAVLVHSIQTRQPDALPARDALRLATMGGAHALGMGEKIGSLEVGKQADIAIFPADSVEMLTGFEPEVMLVHALGGSARAMFTLVAGEERVVDGHVQHDDLQLAQRVSATGRALAQWRAQLR